MNPRKQRLWSGLMAVFLTASLSAGATAQAAPPIVDDALLLGATGPLVQAYEVHYIVKNLRILDKGELEKEDGVYRLQYFFSFDAALRYRSALDTPRVRGIAAALGLEDCKTLEEFLAGIQSAPVEALLSAQAKHALDSYPLSQTTGLSEDQLSQNAAQYARKQLAAFVAEIEHEYIGEFSDFNFDLRISLDHQGKFLGIEYGVISGYSPDLSLVSPAPTEEIVASGSQQALELIHLALQAPPEQTPVFPDATQFVSPDNGFFRAGNAAWINCEKPDDFSYLNQDQWSMVTFSRRNEESVALVRRASTPRRDVPLVYNDGITIKYSSKEGYNLPLPSPGLSRSLKGHSKVEYVIYTKSAPTY
ncbi:MAG: hypothetical protein SOR61_04340 [Evtepia sp.]|uniref:hypothetical protein n=1 Tax=Evtepia sp. TaxID=2773933 RepID=UPI002A7484B3|nr:hypothetical protein [Evtepia sp.]MDY3014411.1 hypothetical protein [Evtepia sp.]